MVKRAGLRARWRWTRIVFLDEPTAGWTRSARMALTG